MTLPITVPTWAWLAGYFALLALGVVGVLPFAYAFEAEGGGL